MVDGSLHVRLTKETQGVVWESPAKQQQDDARPAAQAMQERDKVGGALRVKGRRIMVGRELLA